MDESGACVSCGPVTRPACFVECECSCHDVTWKVRLRTAMLWAVVHKGQLVRESASLNARGWLPDDNASVVSHLLNCDIDLHRSSDPDDSDWQEFEGTSMGWQTHRGIDACITCNCGQVANRKFRVTDSFGGLLQAILEQDDILRRNDE